MTAMWVGVWCCRKTNSFFAIAPSRTRTEARWFSTFTSKHLQQSDMPTQGEGMASKEQKQRNRSFMIVGLGNHGHPNTRHSVGMRAVDHLASKLGLSWETDAKNYGGSICHGSVQQGEKETDLILLKPKALMNVNGISVAKTAKLFSVASSNIFLVHDELDRTVGKFHLKEGGSAGGHNGVLSCMNSLKSNEMLRLRIGISRPASKSMVVPYVLARFSKDELAIVDVAIDQAMDAMQQYIARRFSEHGTNEDILNRKCGTDNGKKARRKERLQNIEATSSELSSSGSEIINSRTDFNTCASSEEAKGSQTSNEVPDNQSLNSSPHSESARVCDTTMGMKKCQGVQFKTLISDDGIVDR